MNDCTYIQITIKTMKYKVKGSCSFFLATGSSYYIRLQRLDQSLSTTMQPSSIKITQKQGRKGPTGTMLTYLYTVWSRCVQIHLRACHENLPLSIIRYFCERSKLLCFHSKPKFLLMKTFECWSHLF